MAVALQLSLTLIRNVPNKAKKHNHRAKILIRCSPGVSIALVRKDGNQNTTPKCKNSKEKRRAGVMRVASEQRHRKLLP
jgi:hypothetical protein